MLFGTTLLAASFLTPVSAPVTTVAVEPIVSAPFHCQVPCGIYGDHLRVELLMEHAATIEKAMTQINEIGAAAKPNWNQLVRWVNTKEQHAQEIQDQLSAYWLAQRIKAPAGSPSSPEDTRKYTMQLMFNHQMTTSAMKCKQTTDAANVAAFRTALEGFKAAYFSKEDMEHIKGHGKEGAGHDADAEHKHDAGDGHKHDDEAAHEHGEGDKKGGR